MRLAGKVKLLGCWRHYRAAYRQATARSGNLSPLGQASSPKTPGAYFTMLPSPNGTRWQSRRLSMRLQGLCKASARMRGCSAGCLPSMLEPPRTTQASLIISISYSSPSPRCVRQRAQSVCAAVTRMKLQRRSSRRRYVVQHTSPHSSILAILPCRAQVCRVLGLEIHCSHLQ